MNRNLIAIVALGALAIGTLVAAQMHGHMGSGMGWHGMMHHGASESMLRHRYVMTNGIEPKYAAAHNPLSATPDNLKEGKSLYDQFCASCHGTSGRGDGPAAKALTPPPADLVAAVHTPMASDAYLDWTIAEGGAPVQSAMPAFKSALASDKIWKIVLYLRTL